MSSRSTNWAYHASGLLEMSSDENSYVTRYEYDDKGRGLVTAVVQGTGGATGPQARTVSSTFNAAGQLIERSQPDGYEHTFVLDSMGRAIEATNPLGDKRRNVYNPAGELTDRRDELGFWTHIDYNERGWV